MSRASAGRARARSLSYTNSERSPVAESSRGNWRYPAHRCVRFPCRLPDVARWARHTPSKAQSRGRADRQQPEVVHGQTEGAENRAPRGSGYDAADRDADEYGGRDAPPVGVELPSVSDRMIRTFAIGSVIAKRAAKTFAAKVRSSVMGHDPAAASFTGLFDRGRMHRDLRTRRHHAGCACASAAGSAMAASVVSMRKVKLSCRYSSTSLSV
jgi:hypothetical protein